MSALPMAGAAARPVAAGGDRRGALAAARRIASHLSGRTGVRRAAAGLVLPALLFALWQLATRGHWLPEQILPAPALVAQSLVELARSGELAAHLAASLARIGWSLLIGGGAGLLLGGAMGLSPAARAYLGPSFRLVAQFPVVGWVPLLIIFVGIAEPLKALASRRLLRKV